MLVRRKLSKRKTSEYILYSDRIMLILLLEYSNIDPVLRWNQTAITVAGVTGKLYKTFIVYNNAYCIKSFMR